MRANFVEVYAVPHTQTYTYSQSVLSLKKYIYIFNLKKKKLRFWGRKARPLSRPYYSPIMLHVQCVCVLHKSNSRAKCACSGHIFFFWHNLSAVNYRASVSYSSSCFPVRNITLLNYYKFVFILFIYFESVYVYINMICVTIRKKKLIFQVNTLRKYYNKI